MSYNSDSIQDMIDVLKRSGYEDYTKYEHQNGTCSINTEMLIKALEDALETKNMHQVFITVNCSWGDREIINTNAPDEVIDGIYNDIKKDDLLHGLEIKDAILDILIRRGYRVQKPIISSFDFKG